MNHFDLLTSVIASTQSSTLAGMAFLPALLALVALVAFVAYALRTTPDFASLASGPDVIEPIDVTGWLELDAVVLTLQSWRDVVTMGHRWPALASGPSPIALLPSTMHDADYPEIDRWAMLTLLA